MPAQKKRRQLKVVPSRVPKKPRRPKDPREVPYNEGFGARLLEAREARKKTQIEMAEALNIGLDQYKKHEYGQTAFPPYLLTVLATILDRSILWFVTGH